jgi:hypothetical protein
VSSATYSTGTPGVNSPAITPPLDGYYDLTISAEVGVQPNASGRIAPVGGGLTADDDNALLSGHETSGYNSSVNVYVRSQGSRQITRRHELNNSSAVQLQYRRVNTMGGSGVDFNHVILQLMATRVAQT